MTMTMYSMKDELNGYTTPIPIMSEELARRYFKDQVLGNPTIKNSPKDFSIWETGTFETETGIYLNREGGAKLIERAENYVI